MKIIDPGHIYEFIDNSTSETITLTFIKRSGGAITYEKEWPGIQTQAVMRALINHLEFLQADPDSIKTYPLWQLGSDDPHPLKLTDTDLICTLLDVLIDRSEYLNRIIECVETKDACAWMTDAQLCLHVKDQDVEEHLEDAIYCIRMALWCYEARAYRRKQQTLNREQPAHDDSAHPRSWRGLPCDDVPFNHEDIEKRPIGLDGHIVLD